MSTWPTEPFIHITAGEVDGHPIRNALAKHEPHYSDDHTETYVIATGPQIGEPIFRNTEGDGIWEWMEVIPIAARTIELLAAAFTDTNLPQAQATALQAVTSYVHPYVKQSLL